MPFETEHRSRRVPRIRTALVIAALVAAVAALGPIAFVASLVRAAPMVIPEYAGPSVPQYIPLTMSLAVSIAPWLCFGTVLLVLAGRFARRMQAAWHPDGVPIGETIVVGERGRSSIEFLLLLPIMISILLLILQVALMVQAKFIVNYAAFCAVRSAIVWIPVEESGGEAHNHIDRTNSGSKKMQVVWRSAALACVPISPHYSSDLASRTGISDATDEQKEAVDRIAHFFPSEGDDNVTGSFKNRLAYAFDPANTTVEIVPEVGSHDQNSGDFGDHDLVTVKVTYRFFLGIPLANRLLGTSFGTGVGGGFFYPITEQYSLLNEGEPLGS